MSARRAQADTGPSFNGVDVECANDRPASVCQIRITRVRNGRIVEVYSTLVNTPPKVWLVPQTPARH